MKTDLYTKTVLTVIAIALSLLALQHVSLVSEAQASTTAPLLLPASALKLNADGSINVRVMNDMDVNIAHIGGSSVYGSLPVNLKELNGSGINTSNGLPVDIEAVNGISIYDAVPVKNK